MKKIIILLILTSIISSLYSQTKKTNYGYILLNNQDTVKGYFINKSEFYSSESVDFIDEANTNKKHNYKSSEITSGKSDKIEIATINVKTSVGYETIIAEKLIIGKHASLYKSFKNGVEFFYIEKDTSIIELSQKYFIGAINVLLGDCNRLKTDYSDNAYPDHKNYAYKESVFAQLVANYNKCKGDASDFTVIKKAPFVNRFGVFVGVTSNTISYNKIPYKDADFKGKITPSFGVLGSTTYKDLIAFEGGLSYSYLRTISNFTAFGTVPLNGEYFAIKIDADLDYKIHMIQIPLALKINLYKYSDFQLYAKGGLSLDYVIINNSTANAQPSLNINASYSDDIQYSKINYSSFWGAGINRHNMNNTLYFLEVIFCTSKSNSTPITSYSWAMERVEGTFNYFTIRLGKTF